MMEINSPEERTAALAFVCNLWVLFPDKLKAREDLSAQIISTLKSVCVDKFRPLRIWANAQMFRLLEKFSEEK